MSMTPKRGAILALICAALLAIAFSGCVSDVADSVMGIEERPWEATQSQKYSAYGDGNSTHKEPVVNESGTSFGFRGVNYLPPFTASKTITVTNGFGGALGCALVAKNCEIRLQAWDKPEYKIVATLEGGGMTPYEAESNLEEIHFDVTDSLSGGVLSIEISVEYDSHSQIVGLGSYRFAKVDAYVPSWLSYDLDASASGGDVLVQGITGGSLSAKTSGGDVSIENVIAGRISIETSGGDILLKNTASQSLRIKTSGGDIGFDGIECEDASIATSGGDISGEIVVDRLDMETSGGNIDIKAESVEYGSYSIHTSGGDVSLYVAGGEKYGYDVMAESTGGQITVRLTDSEKIWNHGDDDEVHCRTRGYESKDVQVEIDIKTSGGDIFVSD